LFVSELYLKNFRNYREATVKAPPGLILITGPNGAGKTNLLEALFFLALGRSFRTSRDRDLVRRGEDALAVRAAATAPDGERTFELDYDGGRKRVAVNGETYGRLIDYVGTLAVVSFSPGDLGLVKDDPSARRRFLDVWLGQQSRDYLFTLQRYTAVLRSRNALLTRGAPSDEVEPFDHELVTAGARLTLLRARATATLGPAAAAAYRDLAPEEEAFDVSYEPGVPAEGDEDDVAAAFERELGRRRDDERRRGLTLVGPHRDDLALLVKGRDARRFASEGQQRTAALSLRVAQYRLLAEERRGDPPLLLLDDVGSELDPSRRERLGRVLAGAGQTWFTATTIPTWLIPDVAINISEGRIAAAETGSRPTAA
jgi:DNA replication and repair protein RecF